MCGKMCVWVGGALVYNALFMCVFVCIFVCDGVFLVKLNYLTLYRCYDLKPSVEEWRWRRSTLLAHPANDNDRLRGYA